MTWLPYTACARCGQEFALDGPDHLCHDLLRAASQTSTGVDVVPADRAPEVSAPLLPTHNAPSRTSENAGE